MKALVLNPELRLAENWPEPVPRPAWAVLRVRQAGICRTDLELVRGYLGFQGVLGHEFVGVVSACEGRAWLGQRVVGEINAACGQCAYCAQGLPRHCAHRSVLGIVNLDGCLAEYCTLPIANLHVVPDELSDDEAVFIEPLSAAFEILEQVSLEKTDRCVVLGDGKLGILCAWALVTAVEDVTLVGRHPEKLAAAQWRTLRTAGSLQEVAPAADLVVEATGSEAGLADAMALCRPRGRLVLKSTLATAGRLNLAPLVINELQLIGSRCGPFQRGLAEMQRHRFPLGRLIAGRYPLDQGLQAFAHTARKGVLKILVENA